MMSKYDAETKTWSGPNVPYPHSMNVTFGEIILKNLSKNPGTILQIFADDDTELTSAQLRIASIRVAQHLQKIGVGEDDVVGLITHHSHFATAFIYGCILIGCIINPLDALMNEEDMNHVFDNTKPKLIVCDDADIPKLQRSLKNVDFTYELYATSDAQSFLEPTGDEANFSCPKFSKPSDEKILVILCSSGTSGKPKSVCLTHANIICSISMLSMRLGLTKTKSLLFSPLYWATGFLFHLAVCVAESDTRIWTSRKFSVDAFVELVEKYQITNVFTAPYALNTLLNSQTFLSSNIECLQTFTVGGAILSEEGRRNFSERLPNRNLMIGYGMTEVTGATVSKPLDYLQGLSVGSIILPNISLKIIDDDGNALDNGKPGEICVRSLIKLLGYYNNPEATSQLIDDDGFVRTGDIGYFNDDGMLFVVDRKKDILKYKGIHLNPSEIENVIDAMEGVAYVSVVGVPDDFCVNLITAAVVKREGFEALTEQEIIDHVASKLCDYKRLSGGVYFFEKLPTTLSGKILKRGILEEILKLRSE